MVKNRFLSDIKSSSMVCLALTSLLGSSSLADDDVMENATIFRSIYFFYFDDGLDKKKTGQT